jgi:hypothetical protein
VVWSNGGPMVVQWWSGGGPMVVRWWSGGGKPKLGPLWARDGPKLGPRMGPPDHTNRFSRRGIDCRRRGRPRSRSV